MPTTTPKRNRASKSSDAKIARSDRRGAADGARPAAQDETLEFGLLEALAQIVCGHYRNNFDFCVEVVKERLTRRDEP